ncbi:MAG: CaiB/BaiF CoA-transferase family protein [Pseudophaeobacter sp. bin_em_oilr2.035]|uniref:CaiB/BaiF CoA-transferase family protein n=1 Tax=Phaeobacter gallaeciensis TaxID=60890 RepID=A0ABD4X9E8_9RHOB|nr:CaiB/BaiF CoA-transferase family protein [Phaeobacter gallaeciensis]MDF1773599.1 CaiB/BaiF CoA-transferase family protein [Pseudophaeobacter sp. bin_em_oilr2.035]MDE4144922.1 CaiB/BaiF CoA-transferase family protein [Phaeobacter gallaeciensis]MDE4157592.1 CaiB/BaiF CoA-transferase family protein [Phaeobacter gallaeciensis]MDE4161773.1 CaiB/BaiF CoA-transferase family protein [Phaeobacter gallaeciensis]MDE4165996.1 CaiB/BaiF CoA-transferase family protein [Phaeobacter gallaeciensis]
MTPLSGLKVVELARILAGPWIGQSLADLGAEVIKVESEAGDDTRHWGPPFIERDEDKTAAYYYAANRGKDCVTADFRTEEGRQTVIDLIKDADILIENFKVGGLKKYGLDYDSLKQVNPRLIYCSVTGFGQDGPYASRAGYDFLLQGMSGLMSITGDPDGQPQKVGVAITDIVTGLYGTIGILAAVEQRHTTGRGQHLDMSLLDCATAMLANQAMNYLATGTSPTRLGNDHPNIAPYQVMAVKDGHIILAVGNDGQFQRLCDALGLPDLKVDPRFLTNQLRVANRQELTALLEAALMQWSQSDLLAALEAATVPAGPINTIGQAFDDPQIQHRGMQIAPEGVPGVRGPWKFSDAELALEKSAPKLAK